VAVAADAIQTVDEKSVFVRMPGGFAAQVTLGRSNGKFVEISPVWTQVSNMPLPEASPLRLSWVRAP
jgi:hypothetical protein